MTGSLDTTQLMDWLEGRLTEAEREAIMAAIQADESSQAELAWLQDFLKFSGSTVMIEPPAELVEQAVANFRAFARGKQPSGWLQKLVATVTFDSWQRPSLAGVRRTGLDAAPRQLVYQTDAADVAREPALVIRDRLLHGRRIPGVVSGDHLEQDRQRRRRHERHEADRDEHD